MHIEITLASQIELVNDALARRMKLYEAEGALMKREDRPPTPMISKAELRKTFSLAAEDIYARNKLEEFFDRHIRWIESEKCVAYPKPKIIADAKAERDRLLALFDERAEAHRVWNTIHGAAAIDLQIEESDAQLESLIQSIIDYRCKTIEEVAMKAKFMLTVFDEHDKAKPFIDAMKNMVELVEG